MRLTFPAVAQLRKAGSSLSASRVEPADGVLSAFIFGRGVGAIKIALVAESIPFDEVTPHKWMTVMGCLTNGDKHISKQRAQQLFPIAKVTHAIADALLSPSPAGACIGRSADDTCDRSGQLVSRAARRARGNGRDSPRREARASTPASHRTTACRLGSHCRKSAINSRSNGRAGDAGTGVNATTRDDRWDIVASAGGAHVKAEILRRWCDGHKRNRTTSVHMAVVTGRPR